MPTVYRKTDKGQQEIATRAHRLAPRLRSALILVDGRRSDAELGTLILPPADEVLAALLADGFIEALPGNAGPGTPGAAAGAPAAAPAVLTLDEVRRRALRWLSDALGPYGDPLNLRIEKARSVDELRTALDLADRFVQQQLGAARAQAFRQHLGLPPG